MEVNPKMEIERKWMVGGWPPQELDLPLLYEQYMRQGYISVRPTVRIREEVMAGGSTQFVLCFKKGAGLVRKEIEMDISEEKFRELEDLIGLPLIPKVRRTYQLPDGCRLEVNHVDEGLPTEFWYAEIEYGSIREAKNWRPADDYLETFLSDEVTLDPSQTMGAYWVKTRL
jgi:CYTH domain-containing protein